ncbi:hypothetical protein O181_036910 [Austropuccinia psidii MF-1]|uniref:Uncharacterized protein n=1 Tax=Austropuccinia psidii MF-1 TaxID=1389203 RepID=A0A9Q3D9U7_9BASI|nr:hypothetical protein [Austropuccinia psidii MF-1]
MVTSLLDRREVIIRPMKGGDGKRTFELAPIVTISCHPWDSNAKVKQNQQNPLQQDSPIPSLPCEKPLRQPTPGLKPSQPNEPPIPGPGPSSKPHKEILAFEPEPEVALMQSMEETFAHPATPPSIPCISPKNPTASYPPVSSSPHSHDEACQEYTDLQPTLMIPQAIVHESINRILLEHCQVLHMIPFVDAIHQNEMHWEFWEELNSLLGQALEAYPKEEITRIV